MRFHTSALYIAREVGDKAEELLQLNNLAYAAVQAEDLGQAVLRYRQALHLAYEQDDRDVNNLQQRIGGELAMQQAQGATLKPVNGTARDYAANAYALLNG